MAANSSAKNKRQEEKYVQMIRDLAALPTNKQCFDCNSKGPTYIDVTVGAFVCTACSGLLRGLNPPHRVKSINMSTFTQDEVEFMKSHGNQLNKLIYLSLYDANAGFSPDPKDTERFKEFLSQKYERKRWYAEPTEAMKQKAKADIEASLDKTTHSAASTKSSSSNLHNSHSITSSIKSPTESTSNAPVNAPRNARPPSVTSSLPPMLVFDAPISTPASNASSTSLFDDFIQSSRSTASATSPTQNFFSDQPFAPTTGSSNDANWGAFVETTKQQPTTITPAVAPSSLSHTMPTTHSTFTQPPAEPVDKYAALSGLFSSQDTSHDQQSSIFGNISNGGHQSSVSNSTHSVFGNAPFSSSSQMPSSSSSSSSSATAHFPPPQPTNMFSSQPFPSNPNPFLSQQPPFGTNPSSLFGMPANNQPNPFMNIAQQPSAQQLPNQFGKPRANSTNPFL